MSSQLPNRWQDILRREAADRVGAVLAQAKDLPPTRRVARWMVPTAVVVVSLLGVFGLLQGSDASRGRVPFDRSTVMSVRTAGLGASAEDLAPAPPDAGESLVAPTPEPTPSPSPTVERATPRVRRVRDRMPELLEGPRVAVPPALAPEATPAPTPTPVPMVVNVGTRMEAVLTDPMVTGLGLAPATARLVKDVLVGDRVALPAGTLLVGEGFATQEGDRAQVVFNAIVKDGRTFAFEGWALQQGEAGVRGKVVRKGSKAKKGAGAALGAAASALTFGAAGALSGAEGAALSALSSTAASDMSGIGRDMRRSDKAIRIEAGAAVTVYLRRDLTLE